MDDDTNRQARHTRWLEWLMGHGLVFVFHGAMILIVAAGLLLTAFDTHSLLDYMQLVRDGTFTPEWFRLALHFGLAALIWIGCVGAFRLWRRRSDAREQRTVRPRQGSVMLETLIVMIPFLLLTSGLGQLAINNVATVLAEYAAFQSVRTAWLWEPEIGAGRQPSGDTIRQADVERRARMAAAGALAPSAPGDFRISNGAPSELENFRGTMTAAFMSGWRTTGSDGKSEGNDAVDQNRTSGSHLHSFTKAFDSDSLSVRAPRKLTYAFLALDPFDVEIRTNEVEVEFTYKLHQTFPWFSYIHGTHDYNVGGRSGYFVNIQRRAILPRQAQH